VNVREGSEPQRRPDEPPPVGPLRFREVQHFRHWWAALIVFGAAIVSWIVFIQQIVLGHPSGTEPAPDGLVWLLTLGVGIGFPVGAFVLRVVTEVGFDELHVRLAPSRGRRIPLADLAEATVVTYRPLRDFGGWGVRWAGPRGVAYNAYGSRGAQLVLHDGRRVLVGSQRPEELVVALAASGTGPADGG
jgi:hypothetical protein